MKKITIFLILIFTLIKLYLLSKYFILDFELIYLKSKLITLIILTLLNITLIIGLKKQKIPECLTIVFSCLFTLYLIETFYIIQNTILKKNKSNNLVFVTPSKFSIYKKLLNNNTYSSPTFSLKKLFDDKLVVDGKQKIIISMPSYTKMIHCYRNGEWIFFKSDRYGFNNLDFYWDNYDSVFIGDSFGIGECVPNEYSIAQLLNNSEKTNGLLNLSQTGNGPLLQLSIILEYADLTKTKNLIWLFFEGNDLSELYDELQVQELLKYLKEDDHTQNLKNYQSNINLHIKNFIEREAKITEENLKKNLQINKSDFITKKNKFALIKNFIKLGFTREKIEFFLYKNEKQFNKQNIFADIILKINNKINRNFGSLYFVYLPTNREILNHKLKKQFELSRKKIIKNLRNNKINIIDIYQDLYLKKKDPEIIFDKINGHYTIEANNEIYEIIKNRMK